MTLSKAEKAILRSIYEKKKVSLEPGEIQTALVSLRARQLITVKDKKYELTPAGVAAINEMRTMVDKQEGGLDFVALSDMVDQAGKLNTEKKAAEKRLEALKKKIRKICKANQLGQAAGSEYSLAATPYIATSVDAVKALKTVTGVDLDTYNDGDSVPMTALDLKHLLAVTTFGQNLLKEALADEGAYEDLIITDKQDFHTLTFSKQK